MPVDEPTPRETEVLALIGLGFTNAQVAEKLHINVRTAESHRANAMAKLRLSNRHEIVQYAITHDLIGVGQVEDPEKRFEAKERIEIMEALQHLLDLVGGHFPWCNDDGECTCGIDQMHGAYLMLLREAVEQGEVDHIKVVM